MICYTVDGECPIRLLYWTDLHAFSGPHSYKARTTFIGLACFSEVSLLLQRLKLLIPFHDLVYLQQRCNGHQIKSLISSGYNTMCVVPDQSPSPFRQSFALEDMYKMTLLSALHTLSILHLTLPA